MTHARKNPWQETNKYLLRKSWIVAMRQGTRFTCGICLTEIGYQDKLGKITVDHIIPRSKGGSDEFDNFQPAHLICNRSKGNNEPLLELEVYKPNNRPDDLQNSSTLVILQNKA